MAIGANVRDVRYYAGLVDEVKIYDVALSENEIGAALKSASVASSPSPEDGATDVPRDVVLSWRPGRLAAAHDVYFGTVFESVNDASRTNPGGVLVQQGQTTNVYDPAGVLAYGETYYWRIDDVNAPPDSTVFKGKTWRFTTEPYSYPLEGGHIKATASSSDDPQRGPEKTVDESGLNDRDEHSTVDTAMWLSAPGGPQPAWIQYEFDKPYRLHQMWVWNSNQALEPAIGLGAKSVTVEYSTDGLAWTKLGEFELARGPGKAGYFANTIVDLAGVAAPQVRLVVNSTWGSLLDQCGLSEVRFFYVPVLPQEPQPSSGQSDVPPDVVLGWRAGREAVSHEVYLGTEAGSLPLAGAANGTSYDTTPLDLQLGATYYWKVHEVNAAETPSSWDGETWSFSTPEYLVVDDFESYTDDVDAGEAIFQTWIDGWEVKGNGSQVGYAQSPFAERTIVHGGKQSMPLLYDNTGGTAYSEIELALDQDWTRHGIATLVLFFHGSLGNTGQLYVKIDGMKIAYPGDAGAVGRPRWTQWNIDLASVGASSLRNTRKLSIGIEGAGSGTICIDDIRLYRTAPAPAAEEIWIQAEAAGTLTAPMKVFDDPMAMGGKCIGTDDAIGNSSSSPPTPNGTATYTFTVKGGVYKISGRVIIPNDESFWVRIPGATTQTHNHSSGWVRWSDPPQGRDWHWAEVFSAEDANAVVQFTMAAGTYQLEIGYREDGALLDAIVIESMD